jgi:hypothetical protein
VNKVQKVLAAVGTAAVLATGATACGNQGYTDNGYEQVWDHGHYVYVPYDYYTSHRSYYTNSLHPAHHASSSYVKSHHVTVTHRTTTTVHKDGSRTTTRHTTTRHTTTRKSSGFGSSTRSRRR